MGAILADSGVVESVGQTRDEAELPALLNRRGADVVVLDRRLRDGASLESITRVRIAAPRTGIVVVGMADSIQLASDAIGAGALGYVLKDAADTDLIDAIVAAARDECYVSSGIAQGIQAAGREGPALLGDSQIAVLKLLARGHAEHAVARELELPDAIVRACRAEIYRRLGIASRAELVRYAMRNGVLRDQ